MVPGITAPGKQVSMRRRKDGWDPSARECVCSVMLREERQSRDALEEKQRGASEGTKVNVQVALGWSSHEGHRHQCKGGCNQGQIPQRAQFCHVQATVKS